MPCHISDGPQEPGDELISHSEEDPDEAYDRQRQQEIDNAVCAICKVEWVDVINGEDTCAGCRSRA